MQSFRTEITPVPSPFSISHKDAIVLSGSCFSENIGQILRRFRFDVFMNSHGIIFNPKSISRSLRDCMAGKVYVEGDLVLYNEIFHSLHHHGRFNHEKREEVLVAVNESIRTGGEKLKSAKLLLVTFGSAWAYRYTDTNEIVANCHKIPQAKFKKQLLDCDEIFADWKMVLEELRNFNPDLKVVFTISPVRHWRDGAVENQWSKAQLILAIQKLVSSESEALYFPAYELVLDDLRDYRFYKEDLLHPNGVATEYVWQKFSDWCFDDATKELLKKLDPLIRFTEHRPLHTSTESHSKILREKEAEIEKLISGLSRK